MKIIISHDVDHYKWTDHFKDLFLIKYYSKTIFYTFTGKLTIRTALKRLSLPFKNQQHRLPELCEFDRQHHIPSTFFVGLDNALGLMYDHSAAKWILDFLSKQGFETGVHGIAYHDKAKIREEFNTYQRLTGVPPQGMRMHYLRWHEETMSMLMDAGYHFNSTLYKTAPPTINNGFIDFPVCMMDVYELKENEKDIATSVAESLKKIEKAAEAGMNYYTIIFHDNYFDEAYAGYFHWYREMIGALKLKGYEFISFGHAINELKNKNA